MTLRTALILLSLFVACCAIVLLAWGSGSEFYFFMPALRRHALGTPPTHPLGAMILLVACAALYLYSPHYALIYFSALLGSLILGSVIGYGVFAWKPTAMQLALTVAMIAETCYGWSVQSDLDV
ncbi:MAG: hypothetical protein ABFC96_12500 [Thermoguttaceae bacterium]